MNLSAKNAFTIYFSHRSSQRAGTILYILSKVLVKMYFYVVLLKLYTKLQLLARFIVCCSLLCLLWQSLIFSDRCRRLDQCHYQLLCMPSPKRYRLLKVSSWIMSRDSQWPNKWSFNVFVRKLHCKCLSTWLWHQKVAFMCSSLKETFELSKSQKPKVPKK